MSNEINTQLLARAHEQMEYWTGTMWERMIQRDIDESDLESLNYHVTHAEAEMSMQEDMPDPHNPSDDATVVSDVRGEATDVY